jgi:exodeoxyribonuclease VII large subunit
MEQMRLDLDSAASPVATTAKATAPSSPDNADDEDTKKSAQPKVLSVSDANRAIKGTLESEYPTLWIKGEISNFKPHSSGHWYFGLKDSKSQINATMFKMANAKMRFRPQDGLEVVVRGRLSVYEPRGNYSIVCDMMEPVGAGALQMAYEQLKRKLEGEGLFASTRKRPLPSLPQHVAVVTSPTGAAIRDILNILGRRFKGLRVTVVPAVVQGDSAPNSICAALALAQRLPDVDVMIVGRGGGSIEDLWGFNDEKVARAIANCRVPIISAVGHEIDFTIADFVADLRAPTPSAAAELVCRNAGEIQDHLKHLKTRLWRGLNHRLQVSRHKLQGSSRRLVDPKRRLQDLMLRCDELTQRLESSVQRYLQMRQRQVQLMLSRLPSPREIVLRLQQRVEMVSTRLQAHLSRSHENKRAAWARLSSLLDAVSPLRVVERGYSIASKSGRVVKASQDLAVGDQLQIVFAKGQADVRVEAINHNPKAESQKE